MTTTLELTARSSSGIYFAYGPPEFKEIENVPKVNSKSCRIILFSSDGKYFAYTNGSQVNIMITDDWKTIATIENTKAYDLAFSPLGTFLMSWEPFTVSNANPQGSPNLHIYKTATGELIKSLTHKKQTNWKPQWSADEQLFSKMQNTDVVFYENLNFDKIAARVHSHKVLSYGLSPNVGAYFLICHTPGSPGQPSFARLLNYPNFDPIANKSFFHADRLEVKWNARGSSALLLTSTEVDRTGGSYYGKQGLHFMALNGQTNVISLGKEGPIYGAEWSPTAQEFCAVYGFTPARATVFNAKGEAAFEVGGAGAINCAHYNPQGNMLLLGGFGNLWGAVEVWDAGGRRKVGACAAPDATLLRWAPNGEWFVTATTAPRVRIGNGYKVWHYSGALLFEKPWASGEELYDVAWKNYPKNAFKDPVISAKKVEGIEPSAPVASAQAYRPPSARNKPAVSFKLYDDEEAPHKPGQDGNLSKASLKQKKRREAKKAQKDESEPVGPVVKSNVQVNLTGDPELDKKLKNIKKKLDAIEKLKEQQAQGKPLEVNQLAKLKGEADLIKELQQLQV